jgi:hypothetical protein
LELESPVMSSDSSNDKAFGPVFDRLWLHTVAFEEPQIHSGLGEYSGMGTLVRANGPCILTAAHVWEERLRKHGTFVVLWQSDRKGRELETSFVTPRVLPRPAAWGEWGPDLALLGLSDVDAKDLENRGKVFFDLDRPRDTDGASAMWTVIGAPGEEVSDTTAGRSMPMHLYPAGEVMDIERAGFDYVDLPARRERHGRPKSYGGISGSGLWRFGWTPSADGTRAWDKRLSFEGVAFWEDEKAFIRCHGRGSIEQATALRPTPDPRLIQSS